MRRFVRLCSGMMVAFAVLCLFSACEDAHLTAHLTSPSAGITEPFVDAEYREQECELGIELELEQEGGIVHSCGLDAQVETWIDLYDCEGNHLPWSRVVIVSFNYSVIPDGRFFFTHRGVDSRDGEMQACSYTWEMWETDSDDDGVLWYTGKFWNGEVSL